MFGIFMETPADGGNVNVLDLLAEMTQALPPPLRISLIGTIVLRLCDVAVAESIPEEDRANPEAWEGHTPRDLFEFLIEPMREALADSERMAEAWNEYTLQRAAEIAESDDEQLTFPDTWTSLWRKEQ